VQLLYLRHRGPLLPEGFGPTGDGRNGRSPPPLCTETASGRPHASLKCDRHRLRTESKLAWLLSEKNRYSSLSPFSGFDAEKDQRPGGVIRSRKAGNPDLSPTPWAASNNLSAGNVSGRSYEKHPFLRKNPHLIEYLWRCHFFLIIPRSPHGWIRSFGRGLGLLLSLNRPAKKDRPG